jgi:aminopeptidase N
MKYFFSFFLVAMAFPFMVNGQPGVPSALAAQRASSLRNIVYDLYFYIPVKKDSAVVIKEKVRFDLLWNEGPLVLDLKKKGSDPEKLEVNGKEIVADHQQEHLLIPARLLHKGSNVIRLLFRNSNPPLNRNDDYCYTLLVPDRARTLFACFDQPDCKAVFNLTLKIHVTWTALANAALKSSTPDKAYQTLRFYPSDKISTYLFAFAAGRFSEVTAVQDGRAMHFFHRETDSIKLRLSLAPIFRIQADALKFMQQYTGMAYPFKKFDFVAIPDFQFGGMEHPGAIQYKASTLFLDSGATRDQVIARSNVLSHETAHMWFGDLVTMTWFNDVWMKEVFANFMADKISIITLPDGKYDLKFLTDHFPAAYSIDRTAGAHPIRQQLDNLQDAGSLYGNIIYHKAPIVMRQLERIMGPDAFREGLRDYLKAYAGGNASWPDLIRILSKHSAADLEGWNRVWVNEPGRPLFSCQLDSAEGRITRLDIRQQGEDGTARTWPQLFEIALVYGDHTEELTVNMNAASVRVAAAAGKPAPQAILFNSSGQGYGVFPIDSALLPKMAALKDPVMRASAYINLYENMLDGRGIDARQLLELDRSSIAGEVEELNLNILLDQLNSIYWRYLPSAARDSLAAGLEEDLWQGMLKASSGNLKKQFFRTYANIVISGPGVRRLYTIWKAQQPPTGVKLSEEDYTGLAAALALRGYPEQAVILEEQLGRIQNADRRMRLQFLMPALSSDTAERDRFFEALKSEVGRKKEAWVLTSLSYLHHPLRTAYSEKYLPETLRLLEEVQRTGDVFFPQGWLGASLSWYRSKTAAAIVRAFLSDHPDYNPKLKAKLLQAADGLFRLQ